MYRILVCTFAQHNLLLLGLAAVNCIAAFAVAAALLQHLRSVDAKPRPAWIFALGLVSGGGAWATHFIAMLAYEPGLPIVYNPFWTSVSAGVGIALAWASFAVVFRWRKLPGAILAGGLFASAIIGLHFLGMLSVEAAATRKWAPDLLVTSWLFCAGLAVLAMRLVWVSRGFGGYALIGALLGMSVVSLHFTAMSALTLIPDPRQAQPLQGMLNGASLGIVIGVVAMASLAVIASLTLADSRLASAKLAGADRTRRLAEVALEGLIVHDGRTVLDVNSRFATMLGRQNSDLVGRPISTFASADAFSCIADAGDTGAPCESFLNTSRGPLEVQLLTRSVEPGIFVTAIRDLTHQRRAEIAESESRAKSRFIANVSHELRTPLTSITSYAELIREVAADEGRTSEAADADIIVRASRHLLALISEILDFAKLEAGHMPIELADFLCADLMSDIAETVRPLALANGNRLDVSAAPDLGYIRSDQFRLRQCLLNLASNAAKFTSDGRVAIGARRETNNEREGICFFVRDTGAGMTAETLTRIFEPFRQGEESATRQFGGTGLGLAITSDLVRVLGGTIDVVSRVGDGSTFTIWIPAGPILGSASRETMMERADRVVSMSGAMA